MGELGERFIRAYNEIDGHMRSATGTDRKMRFAELARTYASDRKLLQSQVDLLRIFGNLRNALAHSEYRGSYPIADPIPQIVADIELLRDKIKSPPQAIDHLEVREVCRVHPDDYLSTALEYVKRFDYSQIPVYSDDGYEGILTTNSIARWLAEHFTEGRVPADTPVRSILGFSETSDCAKLVKQSITAAEAVYELNHGGKDMAPVNALIISERGVETTSRCVS